MLYNKHSTGSVFDVPTHHTVIQYSESEPREERGAALTCMHATLVAIARRSSRGLDLPKIIMSSLSVCVKYASLNSILYASVDRTLVV